MLVDTHCHIHEANYPLDTGDVIKHAHDNGVGSMICVGTNEKSSTDAVAFAANHDTVVAAVGVHPHDTKDGYTQIAKLATSKKVVAVGEIGLDYFYMHSPRETQIKALEQQLQVAQDNNLPVIFHVRDAFDDFWPIFDNFSGIRGVLHSFTDNSVNLEKGLTKGLFIGVNGISTFTKDEVQRQLFASIPLTKLLLETDAPFLTPVPFRGKVNEPAFVRNIAQYHAEVRGITIQEVARQTSHNARELFAI